MHHEAPIILCVDDDQESRSLFERMLPASGYAVRTAVDGRSALEIIQAEKIDLVLLDIVMPGMDGFSVCAWIKGNEKYRTIPVVMLTGLADKDDRIRGIEAGAEEFLSKPFHRTEILARIKMLLKVKSLNSELSSAYNKITRLTTFGEGLINTFNPLEFDFLSTIDSLVSQLIHPAATPVEQPEAILVRILTDRKRHEWYHYTSITGSLVRTPWTKGVAFRSSSPGKSRLLFYNEPQLRDLPAPLSEVIASFATPVSNMTSYLSDNLSIFALNYGQDVSSHDAAVLRSIVMQTLFLRSLSIQARQTEDAFEYAIRALARASEVNDEDTGKHIVRVGHYCALLAEQLQMPEPFVRAIRIQAALHDVGKIHIPPSLLTKQGALTAEEWETLREHPLYGAKIIGDHPRLVLAKSIALTHHERWDGSGYPQGLSGEGIPIEGRIMTIADQYDALRNSRIYKAGFDHKTTCNILINGDGRTLPRHFDPQLLRLFSEMAAQFAAVYDTLQ
jgi:response regulator RpfG family c-di-GMP phosphodiesterase